MNKLTYNLLGILFLLFAIIFYIPCKIGFELGYWYDEILTKMHRMIKEEGLKCQKEDLGEKENSK